MNVAGCFLTVGRNASPQVHLLSEGDAAFLAQRLTKAALSGFADVRLNAYATVFGDGTEYAFPCWIDGCMTAIAMEYVGPHADEVKRIAACIALGQPYSLDENHGGDGGKRAKLDPPKPVKPRPGGAAVAIPREPESVMVGAKAPARIGLKPKKRK